MKKLKIIITTSFLLTTPLLYANMTVLKVEGSAAYKEGNRWLPIKVNQKLAEGVKINTGVNSYVEIKLNLKNHTIQVKPLSMVQIFSKETGGDANINIALKRGSINARVQSNENVKTRFKVETPIATSSVRGTELNVSYGPDRGMVIEVINGEVEGKNNAGRTHLLTGRQKFVQSNSSGQPQHLLQEIRDNSITQVYVHGLTPEESSPMLYWDEQVGSPGGDTSVLDSQSQDANVRLFMDFQ